MRGGWGVQEPQITRNMGQLRKICFTVNDTYSQLQQQLQPRAIASGRREHSSVTTSGYMDDVRTYVRAHSKTAERIHHLHTQQRLELVVTFAWAWSSAHGLAQAWEPCFALAKPISAEVPAALRLEET